MVPFRDITTRKRCRVELLELLKPSSKQVDSGQSLVEGEKKRRQWSNGHGMADNWQITYVERFTGRCRADGTADLPFDGISHVTHTRARAPSPSSKETWLPLR